MKGRTLGLCFCLFLTLWGGGSALYAAPRSITGSWSATTTTLSSGTAVSATLSVWGNFGRKGYDVVITSANATGATQAALQLDSPSLSDSLLYDFSLDTSAIVSPATVEINTLTLNDTSSDVRVTFSGNTTINQASAHQVVLLMTLQVVDPFSHIAGTYQDTITAELTTR